MTLTVVVIGVTCTLIFQIWIWALLFLMVGTLPDLETALYFSTSTYTTVGYGDVVMDKNWRLLGSIEAMNGFMMFGWATAFIFGIVSSLYRKENKELSL